MMSSDDKNSSSLGGRFMQAKSKNEQVLSKSAQGGFHGVNA